MKLKSKKKRAAVELYLAAPLLRNAGRLHLRVVHGYGDHGGEPDPVRYAGCGALAKQRHKRKPGVGQGGRRQ